MTECTIHGSSYREQSVVIHSLVCRERSITNDAVCDQWQSFASYYCFFQLIVVFHISVGAETLTILGSTSQVKERLHYPGRDGGEVSKLVTKAAQEYR